MKLIGLQSPAETQRNWEENMMTLEDIEELEKQGSDVTELRKKYEKIEAQKAAREKQLMDAIDLTKLNNYISGISDAESDIFKKVMTLNEVSKKLGNRVQQSKLVYGSVVQAHSDLWKSSDFSKDIKGAVVLIALDEKHKFDQQWLIETADKISEMKMSKNVPDDNKKFIKTLRDDQSIFCFKVGASIAGDADAWCTNINIYDQRNLPNSCLPPNGILPLLLLEGSEGYLMLIPAKYYTK